MIELQGIGKNFTPKGGGLVQALRDVSLHIDRGEFLAIVGSSGSGKSTLMNLLGLLDQPSAGTYAFEGENVARLSVHRQAQVRNQRMGFVFQAFRLLARTSALENVELPLLYSNRPSLQGLALRALESVGLADRAQHYPSELSGGQQQRVAIARALVNEPDILFADEPTGNLDEGSSAEIMAIFEHLNRAGRTIVLVTHDMELAKRCKRVARIEGGRIVSDSKEDEP